LVFLSFDLSVSYSVAGEIARTCAAPSGRLLQLQLNQNHVCSSENAVLSDTRTPLVFCLYEAGEGFVEAHSSVQDSPFKFLNSPLNSGCMLQT
jgi:hypothetical protein